MMLQFLPFLAQTAPPAAPQGGGMEVMLLPICLLGLMYFLIIRPQQKKQKELNKQIASVKTGDKVITVGGIHGIVTNVKERSFILRIAENTKVEFEKSAVVSILKPEVSEPATAVATK